MLADVFTPVGIYLRLRDRFRDTILLESTDHHAAENSWSFIGINAIAGMEISSTTSIEFKLPGHKPERIAIKQPTEVPQQLFDFMNRFEASGDCKEAKFAQGLNVPAGNVFANNSNGLDAGRTFAITSLTK